MKITAAHDWTSATQHVLRGLSWNNEECDDATERHKRHQYNSNCLTRSETAPDICHLPAQALSPPLETYTAHTAVALLLYVESERQPFDSSPFRIAQANVSQHADQYRCVNGSRKLVSSYSCDAQSNTNRMASRDPQRTYTCKSGGRGLIPVSVQFAVVHLLRGSWIPT